MRKNESIQIERIYEVSQIPSNPRHRQPALFPLARRTTPYAPRTYFPVFLAISGIELIERTLRLNARRSSRSPRPCEAVPVRACHCRRTVGNQLLTPGRQRLGSDDRGHLGQNLPSQALDLGRRQIVREAPGSTLRLDNQRRQIQFPHRTGKYGEPTSVARVSCAGPRGSHPRILRGG